MPRLLLIRHSIPEPDTTVPASQWRLSHRGRALCRPLADRLAGYGPTLLVSSVEPKAVETARLAAQRLGIPSEIAFGLHKHDRSNLGFISEGRFDALVRELFERPGEVVFGTESADQAHAQRLVRIHP